MKRKSWYPNPQVEFISCSAALGCGQEIRETCKEMCLNPESPLKPDENNIKMIYP